MAKTKISEFDSTPANNTDIDSINIAEGCAPSGINNAIRELMSQLKDQQTGASADNFTVGGNLAVTGTTVHTGATTFTGAVTFSSSVVMSTALPVASGGTGASTAGNARTNLSAAASGANADITSITGLTTALTVAQGGTGVTTSTGTGNVVLSASPTFTGVPLSTTASLGTNTTQIATTAFVLANSVPTGVINMWGTATAPTGYLLCAGAAVSRTTYAALFAVISTTFGVGDGSTTFNVPNYTSRFPYGTTLATTGGTEDAVVVSHTHTATSVVTDPTHNHSSIANGAFNGAGAGNSMGGAGNSPGYATTSASTGITVATTNTTEGVSGVGQNLPPYLGINFIIKT